MSVKSKNVSVMFIFSQVKNDLVIELTLYKMMFLFLVNYQIV